jgi:hypothetical protein
MAGNGNGSNGPGRVTRDVEDAVTYPILTEQVTFPRSGGGPTAGISSQQSGTGLGMTAALAIGDVLGWKVSNSDPKGFVGALTQAFTLTDIEGHVESKWNPRTYAVQTDLGGGITGAQASLYTRAKDALDQSLSLLDGLYPLDPEADPEYVRALREMARSQMTEIVREFGAVGLPSVLRIDTYFKILLGQDPGKIASGSSPVQFDPDQVKGTLGDIRDTYGIKFRHNEFNNSIEDEQDITNFRVISDYMTSLMQSWIANREFFFVKPKQPAFFGTQLVLISRQLNVIAETVDELRFVLDSVFIGPNERRTLLLKFKDPLPAMFLEDILEEIEGFVKNEAPRLLRDGGKISVLNNIKPVMESLLEMIDEARHQQRGGDLPDGFGTARVRHAFDDLRSQLDELVKLTDQVEKPVPPPEDKLSISGISTPVHHAGADYRFSIYGRNFHPHARVDIHSVQPTSVKHHEFYSAERIDVILVTTELQTGWHDVTVTNARDETATLFKAFYWGGGSFSKINKGDGSNGGHSTALQTTAATLAPAHTAAQTVAGATSSQAPAPTVTVAATTPAPAQTAAVTVAAAVPAPAPAATVTVAAAVPAPAPVPPATVTVAAAAPNPVSSSVAKPLASAAQISITPATLPNATNGTAYSETLTAQGGTEPYGWAVQPASLPPGLRLSPAGEISGRPRKSGSYTLAVEVTDANSVKHSQGLSITVV